MRLKIGYTVKNTAVLRWFNFRVKVGYIGTDLGPLANNANEANQPVNRLHGQSQRSSVLSYTPRGIVLVLGAPSCVEGRGILSSRHFAAAFTIDLFRLDRERYRNGSYKADRT